MAQSDWWGDVEGAIEQRFLMKHPFNVAWRDGKLKLENIQLYAKQYYHHVDFFPRYISAVHSNTQDMGVRQMLVENLADEEKGEKNHPELWLRFCEGAGLRREDVLSADLLRETKSCVSTYMGLARSPNYLAGLAALYAYESQVPKVSETKVKNLDVHYGIIDEKAYEFFRVHEKADVWHSKVEREALQRGAKTDEDRALVLRSVESACQAIWNLFDGVSRAAPLGSA